MKTTKLIKELCIIIIVFAMLLNTNMQVFAYGGGKDNGLLSTPGGNAIKNIAAGHGHTIALKSDGTVWTWGLNNYGQLGDGTTTNKSNPIQVSGLSGVIAVSSGYDHSMALKTDGTVWTWGWNNYGQLGNGTINDSHQPIQVSSLNGIVAISAGYGHSIALKSDGTVWTWGRNAFGELGDSTPTQRNTPAQVSGISGIVAISGAGLDTIVLKSDGTVWAWGSNTYGQLGNGNTYDTYTPTQASGLSGVVAVSGGYQSIIALKTDNTLRTIGRNVQGDLGDGTTTSRNTPVQPSGLSGVVAISGGQFHAVALKTDGTVWDWGYNSAGQLGDNTATNRTVPIQVSGISGVVAISGGYQHTVALKTDGTVWSWGDNQYGQLGDGTTINKGVPVQVSGLNIAPPPPPPSVPTATLTEVRDLYNNNNASDIRVIFKGASDESKIASYKIIVAQAVGTQPTDAVNSGLTTAATNTVTGNYISEPVKRKGRLHLFTLSSAMQTYDNKPINAAAGALKVYVLSVAKTGSSDKLSAGVDLIAVDGSGHTLSTNNDGYKVVAPIITVSDLGNTGSGDDLRVSFKKPQSEVNISEYRIIVVPTNVSNGVIDLTAANGVAVANLKQVSKTGAAAYTIRMTGKNDSTGTVIKEGVDYKVYILVKGANFYPDILSNPSKVINLSKYVPGALAIRGVSVTKAGTGHNSSNIKVTFTEPVRVADIQEYRIMVVPAGTSLTQTAADGVTLAPRYQSVTVVGGNKTQSIVISTGKSDYNGTPLAAGDYRVYVQTVGLAGYGNKLSAASGIIKLD